MFGTSWGSYFYIIHEGTITGTLIKLKPKQGTGKQGTLSGTFGQEKKERTWYITSQIREMSYLKEGKKTGKLSNLGFWEQGQKRRNRFIKKQQYNNRSWTSWVNLEHMRKNYINKEHQERNKRSIKWEQ